MKPEIKKKIYRMVSKTCVVGAIISLGVMVYPTGGYGPTITQRYLMQHPEVNHYLSIRNDLNSLKSQRFNSIMLNGNSIEENTELIEEGKKKLLDQYDQRQEQMKRLEKRLSDLEIEYPIKQSLHEFEKVNHRIPFYFAGGFLGLLSFGLGAGFFGDLESRIRLNEK